jgi:hypothetical protein
VSGGPIAIKGRTSDAEVGGGDQRAQGKDEEEEETNTD